MSLEVAAERRGQLRALSHPVRLRILSMLTGRALSSAELARELGMKHAAVSYHVRQLERAGYVEVAQTRSVRGGQERRYRSRPAGRAEWAREDPQLTIRAVTGELSRRLAEGPSSWRVFADAELWVAPSVWEDVRQRVGAALTDLDAAAAPPRSPGMVHVSATAMLFQVDDPGPDSGSGPGSGPTGGGR